MKQVDVLMPVFNDAPTIDYALQSMLEQSYSGDYSYNVIVLPNGCTDRSAQLAEEWIDDFIEHKHLDLSVIQIPDPNKIQAINVGLRATANEVVICADGDVEFSSHCFDTIADVMQDPKVMVSGAVPRFVVPEQTRRTFLGEVQELADLAWGLQPVHTQPFGGTMAFKRNAVPIFPDDAGVDDTWLGLYAAHRYGNEAVQIAQEAYFVTDFPTTWTDWLAQRTRWVRNDNLVADRFPEFQQVIKERRLARMKTSAEVDRRLLAAMQTRNTPPNLLTYLQGFVRMCVEEATLSPGIVRSDGTWDRQQR